MKKESSSNLLGSSSSTSSSINNRSSLKRKLDELAKKKRTSKSQANDELKIDDSMYGSDGELLPCYRSDFVVNDGHEEYVDEDYNFLDEQQKKLKIGETELDYSSEEDFSYPPQNPSSSFFNFSHNQTPTNFHSFSTPSNHIPAANSHSLLTPASSSFRTSSKSFHSPSTPLNSSSTFYHASNIPSSNSHHTSSVSSNSHHTIPRPSKPSRNTSSQQHSHNGFKTETNKNLTLRVEVNNDVIKIPFKEDTTVSDIMKLAKISYHQLYSFKKYFALFLISFFFQKKKT